MYVQQMNSLILENLDDFFDFSSFCLWKISVDVANAETRWKHVQKKECIGANEIEQRTTRERCDHVHDLNCLYYDSDNEGYRILREGDSCHETSVFERDELCADETSHRTNSGSGIKKLSFS